MKGVKPQNSKSSDGINKQKVSSTATDMTGGSRSSTGEDITTILKNQQKVSTSVESPEMMAPKDDLKEFLMNVYQSNATNRELLLQIEKQMVYMVNNKMHKLSYTYPPLSSFHRMLIHRVAEYFMLGHEVDSTGKQVIVYTTPQSCMPLSLGQLCNSGTTQNKLAQKTPPVVILRKPSRSEKEQQSSSSGAMSDTCSLAHKSFEERRDSYIKARARIFDVPVGDCENVVEELRKVPREQTTAITSIAVSESSATCSQQLSERVIPVEVSEKKVSFLQCIHDAARRNSSSPSLASRQSGDVGSSLPTDTSLSTLGVIDCEEPKVYCAPPTIFAQTYVASNDMDPLGACYFPRMLLRPFDGSELVLDSYSHRDGLTYYPNSHPGPFASYCYNPRQ